MFLVTEAGNDLYNVLFPSDGQDSHQESELVESSLGIYLLFHILILMSAGSRVCKQLVNTLIDLTLMLLASPLNWKEKGRTGLHTVENTGKCIRGGSVFTLE